jgi:hypothetical protein
MLEDVAPSSPRTFRLVGGHQDESATAGTTGWTKNNVDSRWESFGISATSRGSEI